MKSALKTVFVTNWKTSTSGLLLILVGIAGIAGVHVTGFTMEPGAAISAGIGLLVAKDAGAAS